MFSINTKFTKYIKSNILNWQCFEMIDVLPQAFCMIVKIPRNLLCKYSTSVSLGHAEPQPPPMFLMIPENCKNNIDKVSGILWASGSEPCNTDNITFSTCACLPGLHW